MDINKQIVGKGKAFYIKLGIFFVLVSIISVLPFIFSMLWNSHDLFFHMDRIESLGNIFSSPVNLQTHPYGNLINLMYPFITIYPAQIIFAIVGNIKIAYVLLIFMINLASLLIAYFSFNRIYNNIEWSIIFALFYATSAYRLIDIYISAALGEGMAMTFLPLAFLGLWYILANNYKKWYIFSIALALVVYSHVLSTYILAMCSIFAVAIGAFFIDEKLQRIIAFVKGSIVGVVLALPVIVNIASEMLTNKLLGMPKTGDGFASYTVSPLKLITNSLANNIFSMSTLGTISFLLIILSFIRWGKQERLERVILVVATLVFLSTSTILPWKLLLGLKVFSLIQFSSRLLVIPTLLIAIVGVRTIYTYGISVARIMIISMFAIALITLGISSYFFVSDDYVSSKLNARQERLSQIDQGEEEAGTLSSDYTTKEIATIMHAAYAKRQAWNRPYRATLSAYRLDGDIFTPTAIKREASTLSVEVDLDKPGKVQLPLSTNNESVVKIDGKPTKVAPGKFGMEEVAVSKGKHTIEASYRWLPHSIISFFIALISWLVLLAWIWKRKLIPSSYKKHAI